MKTLSALLGAFAVSAWTTPAVGQVPAHLAGVLDSVMHDTGSQGIAAAIIEDGQVITIDARGKRNASGADLDADTVMYGASLTKAAFAYMVLQLVDDGLIDLDRSIADYLPRPLTDYGSDDIEDRYARYSDLAGMNDGERSRPAYCCLTGQGSRTSGFSNRMESSAFTLSQAVATPIPAMASCCSSSYWSKGLALMSKPKCSGVSLAAWA